MSLEVATNHLGESAAGSRTRRQTAERWAFIALLFIQLLPIWIYRYFPSHDGPSHLVTAQMILNYNSLADLQQRYEFHVKPDPNWTATAILATGMIALPPLIAEKLLVSLYVLLLPLSVRFAVRAVNPDSVRLSWLAFPFTYNVLLHSGFYNFCYGTAVFILTIAYWWKYRHRLRLFETVVFSLILLLLCFSHLVPFVLAAAAIGLLAGVQFLRGGIGRAAIASTAIAFLPSLGVVVAYVRPELAEAERLTAGWLQHILARRELVTVVAGGFVLLLSGLVLGRKRLANVGGRLGSMPGWGSSLVVGVLLLLAALRNRAFALGTWRRTTGMLRLDWLAASSVQSWAAVTLALTLATLCLYALSRRIGPRDPEASRSFGILIPIFYFTYVITPNSAAGGSFIATRVGLAAVLLLFFWLAAQRLTPRLLYGSQVMSAAISLVLLASNVQAFDRDNRLIAEYVAVSPQIEPNTTLFAFCPRGPYRGVDPLAHADGYIGVDRHAIVLRNYQVGARGFPFTTRSVQVNDPDFVLIWARGELPLDQNPDRLGFHSEYALVSATQSELAVRLYRRSLPKPNGKAPAL